MRKLGILVMAMTLVLGMSFGVMARDEAEITVNVPKYATLSVGNDIELNFDTPRSDSTYEGNNPSKVLGSTTLTVESNTPALVSIEENMTQSLKAELGGNKVWPWQGDTSKAVVAPWIWVTDPNRDFTGAESSEYTNIMATEANGKGQIVKIDHPTGETNYTIHVENKWFDSANWYELTAGTKTYEITATVSAK